MSDFSPVKVDPFLRSPVKVEIEENRLLTLPNNFLDLSQLLPTFFRKWEKSPKRQLFQLLPPIL